MDAKQFGGALQGMGAWWAGRGPQYENAKSLARQVKNDEDEANRRAEAEQRRAQRAQALNLAQGVKQMYAQHGAAGAMAVLNRAASESDPFLAPAINSYAQLLQSADEGAFLRELDGDIVGLGESIQRERVALQKGGTFATQGEDGSQYVNIPIFNPNDPENPISINSQRLPGMMVNSAGMTKDEQARYAGDKAAATEQAKSGEALYVDIRDRGLEAARAMPTIKRSMEILSDLKGGVETGGFETAKLKAKKFFGIESADEASLTNLLGKAVLSQLRATFGAQFTAAEGAQLERIEANIGNSTAGNIRILADLMKLNQKKVAQAAKAAKMRGDSLVLDEINAYSSMELSPREEPSAPQVKFMGFEQ